MQRENRRKLIGWISLLGISMALSLLFMTAVAHFVGDGGVAGGGEPSYLARTGHRCLGHIPEVDVEPSEGWRSHWSRLGEEDCKPGSWLYQFREDGQSLSQYRVREPNRASEDAYFVLTRLGEARHERAAELVEPVREFLALFFQRDVSYGPAMDLPAEAFHENKGARGQYDAELVLDSLVGTCEEGAAACLAVTDRDLFVDKLQYVFGLGHFRKRVGVFSTYRLWEKKRDPITGKVEEVRRPEPLRRALKVAVHEMAHELSVAHCVHYRDCVMAGTNSLAESDQGTLMLCPLDHAKLQWNLRFDPHDRFVELADWADVHGLHAEAGYWRSMAREYPAHTNAAGGGG
jgi:predicted Zn-dependent protease